MLAYAAAAASGWPRLRTALTAVFMRLDTHALAIAATLAAATAGVGIGLGTYAASGADAGGYIGQADLFAHGQLLMHEPLAQRVSWPDAAWTFAPLGFRPGDRPGDIVPTYPPGLPAAMRLASIVAGDVGPFLVAPLLGAIGVVATCLLGARLHTRSTGLVAGALMATSPVWLFQIVQAMSDVPATALWTLALLAAASSAPLAAGLATSLAVLVRPNLFPIAAAVAVILVAWPHESPPPDMHARIKRLLRFAAVASIGAAVVAAFQWRLYGSPLASGHGSLAELFAPGNVAANIRDYAIRLLTGETPALALSAAALAIVAVARGGARDTPSVAKPVRLLLLTATPVLICYLPYGVFPDWSYLRFLMPAFPAAFILVGALTTNACRCLPAPLQGSILVLAIVGACSANVNIARREAAFDVHAYEARYRTAGRYLDVVLPQEAVIVTSQESASAWHYTKRPILRWDLLSGDLDAAVTTLVNLRRHPVLLIEDWEEPILRARFPSSALARVDWRSRAVFGTTTRVRYLDPADRDESGPTDRLP